VFDLKEGDFDSVFVHLGSRISPPTTIDVGRPAVLTRNASSRHSVPPPNDPPAASRSADGMR
jgi:hypothetical protein